MPSGMMICRLYQKPSIFIAPNADLLGLIADALKHLRRNFDSDLPVSDLTRHCQNFIAV